MAIPTIRPDTPILVTGATGLVGSYVCRSLLAVGYRQVYAQRRRSSTLDLYPPAEAAQLHWREADLEDYFAVEDLLQGVSVVIHCAALVSFQPGDKARLLAVNRDGTKHLVDAALHHGIELLVHLSSVSALGRNRHGIPITEQSKWENGPLVSNYSLSKFLADTEVWRGQAEGLPVTALYPTVILGAGRWNQGSVKIIEYAANAPRFYPAGSTGIVDVRDVARAVLLVLEQGLAGERLLLNGTNVSFRDLLTELGQEFGHAPPARLLPQWIARWGARLDSWRTRLFGGRALLTPETVLASYQHYRYDNSRSQEVLGLDYQPLAKTLRDTISVWNDSQGQETGWFTKEDLLP